MDQMRVDLDDIIKIVIENNIFVISIFLIIYD